MPPKPMRDEEVLRVDSFADGYTLFIVGIQPSTESNQSVVFSINGVFVR